MVQVKVNEGLLEGELVDNKYGGKYFSFKGIPYAEPPIGNLRFKAPQPKKPWTGVRSAKEFGPICYQINKHISSEPVGSEDCLYLNVYTPTLNPPTGLPIMFWIHGGAFRFGSGNDDYYGPELLIQHDVILVTINYRLEALGFLCLDTEEIPGNAGMKDQVEALRWVHKNISNFGGDPNNITIFGESAGGASTSYHLVSPMSNGLYKRAIVQSGTMAGWWTQQFQPREIALKLARTLGCFSEDDQELVEFFRNVPVEKLVELNIQIVRSVKSYEPSFMPVNEKKFGDNERFFYGDNVCDVLKNGIHEGVEIMTGYTADEGIFAITMGTIQDFISEANGYYEFFVPKQIRLSRDMKSQLEAGKKMKEFYFQQYPVSEKNQNVLFRFFSMDMFIHNALLFAKLASMKNKLYLYKMTCTSDRNGFSNIFKLSELVDNRPVVCHADDLFYLFPMKICNIPLDQGSEAYTYVQRMTTLWTNFAKFGNPTPDENLGVKWSPYSLNDQSYVDIGTTLVTGTKPDQEDVSFWEAIFKEYLPCWSVQ